MKKRWSSYISIFLVVLMLLTECIPAIGMVYAYANPKTLDLMVRFYGSGDSIESRKRIALESQQEAVELLEEAKKNGRVESYESFYISNAMHIIVKDSTLVAELSRLSSVESIQENGRIEAIEPVEDEEESMPMFFARGDLYVPDYRDIEWGVLNIHADKVWEDFGIYGENTVVGIIDSGVNYNLPALRDNFIEGGYKDFVDGLSTPQVEASNDHGTHVAGTIVGEEGERLNRIGVAPKAKFISARALGPTGGDISDLLAAAQWMLEKKPDVINNSWGGSNDDDKWFADIVKAWTDEGIIPVFAAGNTSDTIPREGTISNPGNYLDVLSVAAVDKNNRIGRFSNKGPSAFDTTGTIIKPEISAPGVQVRSVNAEGVYVSWNGTSMAAPHVAGVVALIRSAAKKAGVSEQYDSLDEIRNLIIETASPISDHEYPESPNMAYGYGLINAYDAVAKVMGQSQGSIEGGIYVVGEDKEIPQGEFKIAKEAYLGRDVSVNVQVQDDISIRSVELEYWFDDDTQKNKAKLVLGSGIQNNGVYTYLIKSDALSEGTLYLKVNITDYAKNVVVKEAGMHIKPGMSLPWVADFDDETDPLAGFILEGSWGLSDKKSSMEPELPGDTDGENKKYLGINAGMSGFEKRVDSYAYLPPINLRNVEGIPSVSFDMYNGFTGISTAKLQASTDNETWEDIYQVIIRPDIVDRKWEHASFSLEKYKNTDKPLLLRFYFHGHDADEGIGWYLDNMQIKTGEDIAPGQVQDLRGKEDQKGLLLNFIANEETDMASYRIERSEDGISFNEIGSVSQNLSDFRFINKGEDTRYPSSHYRVEYREANLDPNRKYYYRVIAIDQSGNESPASKVLEVIYSGYISKTFYDFEENDGGFKAELISSSINDWEWGSVAKPDTVTEDSPAPLRWTWEGIMKNPSKVWGTRLNQSISKGQDSALYTPWIVVGDEEYLYFDSFNAQSIIGDGISFTVEVREKDSELWSQIVSREDIMQAEQLRTWFGLSADLSAYKDKEIQIRFRVHTETGIWIDNYNLGWYIDNVNISKKQIEFEKEDLVILATASDTLDIIDDRTSDLTENTSLSMERTSMINTLTDGYLAKRSGETKIEEGVELAGNNVIAHHTSSTNVDHGYYKENHIPIRARIKILETGSQTYTSDIDGYFRLKHSTGTKPYTLEISAYGYQTELRKVNLHAGKPNIRLEPIVLQPAGKIRISGKVMDENGNALSGVKVDIADDVEAIVSDENGYFSGEIYAGEYYIRFIKEGYLTWSAEMDLNKDNTEIEDIYLREIGERKKESIDYGYKVEKDASGNYTSIAFKSGIKGMAVKFQSPYEGSIVKSADIFFVNNEYFGGNHVKIGILSYDKKGRLRELVEFKEYDSLVPNAWNTIDFSRYSIQTNDPIYIATSYDMDAEPIDSMAVFYDVNATEIAKSKSFIYDGAFTKTSEINPFGAYAVKLNYLYEEGAKKNTSADSKEGAGNPDSNKLLPTDAKEFEFDKISQTITAYHGEAQVISIPAEIDGIPVKAIGDNAFIGRGKEIKLRRVTVPEGVERIGKNAFQGNEILSISLPESLQEIGEGAFMWQSKYNMQDQSFDIKVPKTVKVIKENTFYGAGSPLRAELEGVEKIEKNAFAAIAAPVIYADSLQEIAEEAFGRYTTKAFTYAMVYTKKDTALESKDHEYLINPAMLDMQFVDARDHEHILKKETWYGQEINAATRDYPVSRFFRQGRKEQIKAPAIRMDGISYLSGDEDISTVLEDRGSIEFHYYEKKPRIREPILHIDDEILGFAVPNQKIEISIDGNRYETISNEDGFFEVSVGTLSVGSRVQFYIDSDMVLQKDVSEYRNETYIIEDGVIKRYLGSGGSVTLPIAGTTIVKEIGNFAFYGKALENVILPDAITSIGSGAFMRTGLKNFGWNLRNIDDAKLRYINEYAFRDNFLVDVKVPYLVHVIRTGAFENNEITDLKLGLYTGHIGDKAFRNNKLKTLELPATIEEIGSLAFADNRLEKVVIPKRLEGYTHGLEEIPALAFSGNRIKEFIIPDTITYIDAESFAGNSERFIIRSDVETIVPSRYYDVVRSDSTLLRWEDKKESDNRKPDSIGTETGSKTNTDTILKPSDKRGGSTGSSLSGAGQKNSVVSKLPQGYAGLSKIIKNYKVPNEVGTGTWTYHNEGYWTYQDALGQARNTWKLIYTESAMGLRGTYPYAWYHFDETGKMRTGFYTDIKGDTYFFDTMNKTTEGAMLIGWQKIGEHWYYFNPNYGSDMGKMLKNTMTPDGYRVNEKGIWIK